MPGVPIVFRPPEERAKNPERLNLDRSVAHSSKITVKCCVFHLHYPEEYVCVCMYVCMYVCKSHLDTVKQSWYAYSISATLIIVSLHVYVRLRYI